MFNFLEKFGNPSNVIILARRSLQPLKTAISSLPQLVKIELSNKIKCTRVN
jgi:hypothetical protein